MADIYRPLFLNQAPIMYTGRRTAELIKYAANAFLATKITFINEIADLCEQTGANVQEVARGIGLDNRIGAKFLNAGPGYGGSCFPKDALALLKTAQDFGTPSRIVETVVSVNEQRKRAMARKVIAACGGSIRGHTIAVLGLTFKPNTDDMRDAPSIALITALRDAGANVRAFDPEGMKQARAVIESIEYADSAYACIDGADALVIVTEWEPFRALDLDRVQVSPEEADRGRSAQRLPSGGHGAARLHLCQHRPARRWQGMNVAAAPARCTAPAGGHPRGPQRPHRRAAAESGNARRHGLLVHAALSQGVSVRPARHRGAASASGGRFSI